MVVGIDEHTDCQVPNDVYVDDALGHNDLLPSLWFVVFRFLDLRVEGADGEFCLGFIHLGAFFADVGHTFGLGVNSQLLTFIIIPELL